MQTIFTFLLRNLIQIILVICGLTPYKSHPMCFLTFVTAVVTSRKRDVVHFEFGHQHHITIGNVLLILFIPNDPLALMVAVWTLIGAVYRDIEWQVEGESLSGQCHSGSVLRWHWDCSWLLRFCWKDRAENWCYALSTCMISVGRFRNSMEMKSTSLINKDGWYLQFLANSTRWPSNSRRTSRSTSTQTSFQLKWNDHERPDIICITNRSAKCGLTGQDGKLHHSKGSLDPHEIQSCQAIPQTPLPLSQAHFSNSVLLK